MKQTSEFNRKKYASGNYGLRGMCKDCSRIESNKYDAINKKKNKKKLREIRDLNKCQSCGITHTDSSFFDWHHIVPREVVGGFKIPNIMHHSWAKVLRETEKCLILCPNCHRDRHL